MWERTGPATSLPSFVLGLDVPWALALAVGHLAPVGASGATATLRTSAYQEVNGSILSSLLILQMRKQKSVTSLRSLALKYQTETRAQPAFSL